MSHEELSTRMKEIISDLDRRLKECNEKLEPVPPCKFCGYRGFKHKFSCAYYMERIDSVIKNVNIESPRLYDDTDIDPGVKNTDI